MSKNKIIFTISTFGHGKGGHFYSLHTIAEELSNYFDITIINIGAQPSPILTSEKYHNHFIRFSGKGFISIYSEIKRITQHQKPVIINAFDIESFAWARCVGRKTGIPVFHTKCGGPNPNGYFPKTTNLILFSKENEEYFLNHETVKNRYIELIPNRVSEIHSDEERISELRLKHGLSSNNKVLLRITRIGEHYKTSIEQGIELTKWLKAKGIAIKFLIVGEVQDPNTLSLIRTKIESESLEKTILIENDSRFTLNASQLLPVADLVIGSGRNFMETTSFNIPLLTTLKNETFPLLVTDENFDEVFKTNFSPRTKISDYDESTNLIQIEGILSSENHSISTFKWYENYFSVRAGAEKYKKLYSNPSIFEKEHISLDALKNVFYTILRFRKARNK
jgi:hypothetical protein